MKVITKVMLKVVEGVKPSSTLIKVKDSNLRHITDLLIDHRLVVRKENERSLYIPENHYHLIYDSISNLAEYKLTVNQDLNSMMTCAIEDWLSENELNFDEKLIDSKISKTSHILNKIKGTTKIRQVSVGGKKSRYRFTDKRLVSYVYSQFKNHPDFKKRFIK